jgi:uncharacterized membrane protein
LHLTELDDTGVSAQLDEDGPTIVFGTVPFVREKGIAIRHLAEDIPGHVYKRLYAVAVNGKTAAIFLVRYQLRRHVPAFLREMKRVGVPVAMRTQDPCVRAEIVKQILSETPRPPQVVKPEQKQIPVQDNTKIWMIVLLVLGSPLWIPLVVSAVSVVFSVYVSLWSVVISLYAVFIALAASAVGCIVGSFFMIGNPGTGMVAWGAALVCAGLAILLFMLSNLAAKSLVKLTKWGWKSLKRIFRRKERTV